MSELAIRVQGLVRTFEDVQAVRGIDFTVNRGQVVGFVGANGAGKTTTMRMLVTLDLPTAGAIEVCGFDAVSHPGELRHRVGWMPDGYGAYPDVTVKEYLDFMARAFGYNGADRRARVDEVMAFTDLVKLADREMKALSKGMSQRLCLGRALINDPEVMILDEPAAGLDPKARAEFKRLVRLLAEDGKTILISSHILSELAEMCDSLLFIDGGRIVYDGPAEGLTQPGARRHIVRVEALEPAEALAEWAGLAAGVRLVDVSRRGVRLEVEAEGDVAVAAVLAQLMQEGFQIIRFAPEEVRLEDAFIALLDKVKEADMARREPSDWLSPVLVKEMRQGLKSRVFTLAFLVIQVAMLCAALVVLTMNGGQEMREASAVMFWGFTLSMVVVLMPLMGLNSLASELKDQTFELVLLTRLTAWRIVSGKWASLVGQIALVTSGLLPYLVLRYYLGGVELLLELLLIPLMLFLAAALCAVTLYASTYTSGLARLAVLGVQGLVFVFGLGMASSLGRRGTSGTLATGGLDGAAWVVFGCALALCVAILLQAAATRIAPPAENHAAVKRGLAVVLALLALVPMQGELQLVYLGALTPVLGLVGLDACSEGIAAAPTAYLPYARWRFPGLGALLYPGWPGGLAFTAVIGALVTVRIVATSAVEAGDAALAYLGFVAAVAVPVALSRLGRKGRRFVVGWAVAFHGLALTLGAVAGQLADVAGLERDAGVAAVSPLAAVVLSADNELGSDVGLVLVAQLGWLVLAALILARFGRDEVAEVSTAARRARGLPNP